MIIHIGHRVALCLPEDDIGLVHHLICRVDQMVTLLVDNSDHRVLSTQHAGQVLDEAEVVFHQVIQDPL